MEFLMKRETLAQKQKENKLNIIGILVHTALISCLLWGVEGVIISIIALVVVFILLIGLWSELRKMQYLERQMPIDDIWPEFAPPFVCSAEELTKLISVLGISFDNNTISKDLPEKVQAFRQFIDDLYEFFNQQDLAQYYDGPAVAFVAIQQMPMMSFNLAGVNMTTPAKMIVMQVIKERIQASQNAQPSRLWHDKRLSRQMRRNVYKEFQNYLIQINKKSY